MGFLFHTHKGNLVKGFLELFILIMHISTYAYDVSIYT